MSLCVDGKGERCFRTATVRLYNPKGKPVPGPAMCAGCAQEVIDEYRAKVGEVWTFKPIPHDPTQGWNSRFVQYARVHGRTPEEQLAHDQIAFPGGVMAGYIIWNDRKWTEYHKLRGWKRHDHVLTTEDHEAYDNWLSAQPLETTS